MDVFCPCAWGGILNENTIPQLKCRAVVGAANNQLGEEIPDSYRLHDNQILYVPDYVANAGGLVSVAEELTAHREGRPYSAERVIEHVRGIGKTVDEILERSGGDTPPSIVAHEIGEERVNRGSFNAI